MERMHGDACVHASQLIPLLPPWMCTLMQLVENDRVEEAGKRLAMLGTVVAESDCKIAQLQAHLQEKDIQRIQACQQLRRVQKTVANLRKAKVLLENEAGPLETPQSSRRTTRLTSGGKKREREST
jgi:hypothetical protein